jgi:peptidoglycan/xylan/chitin deacetylase (PgdA/CDA1 family)
MTDAAAMRSALTAGQASPATFDSFVALMYHNIAADDASHPHLGPSATSYFVSRAAFGEHLGRIADADAVCMDLGSVQSFYRPVRPAGAGDGRPRVLFTFDDGWSGAVEIGGPLLERHHARAIIFVTTGFLGRQDFLTRGELFRIDRAIFHVGAHGRTHRMLSLLGDEEIRAELAESKALLEDVTGHAVETLSIPGGAVDARVRRIAAECGYKFLFDSDVRVNRRGDDPMAIARVAIMRSTRPDAVDRYVHQRLGRERLRRAMLQAPKRLLGLPRYERVRRRLLGEKSPRAVTPGF